MLHLGVAPAWPRQPVVLALHRPAHAEQRGRIELVLVLHVQLHALRALPGVADHPGAAIELARDVLGHRLAVLDCDALEQLVGEAELARQELGDLVVALGLEDRIDHLLAPLQR
jgi:hypothetical protein